MWLPDSRKVSQYQFHAFGRERAKVQNVKMATSRDKKRRALAVLILVDIFVEEGKKNDALKRNRVVWTRDWIKRRRTRGVYHLLVKELELEDEVAYTEFFRVNWQKFRFLVDSVGYAIEKKDTLMRESIRPD